jgi:ResB-like family
MLPLRLAAAVRSAKLTVALLFILAVLALLGTIPRSAVERGQAADSMTRVERFLGIRDTFGSPAFLSAACLLTVNILFCTAHRCSRLKRNSLLMLADLLMHLSVVLVIAGGAVKGFAGVVRTASIPIGTETATAFDWKIGADTPLGFVIRVIRLDTEYHPFRARIGLRDTATARKIGIVEVAEGGRGDAALAGVELSLAAIDREGGRAALLVKTPAAQGRIQLSLASGPGSSAQFGGVGFTLVAYQDEPKMVRALINAVLESGLVVEKWISPNEGIDIEGNQVSLTAWGRDPFGNPYAGFQVSRDPGAWLFWAGCILLAGAIPLHLFVKHRRSRR